MSLHVDSIFVREKKRMCSYNFLSVKISQPLLLCIGTIDYLNPPPDSGKNTMIP